MSIIKITRGKEEIDELLGKGKFVVLDHMTTWCGPCKQLMRYLLTIVDTFPNVIFASVDLEGGPENEKYAETQDLEGVPTVYLYDTKGNLIDDDMPIDKNIVPVLTEYIAKFSG